MLSCRKLRPAVCVWILAALIWTGGVAEAEQGERTILATGGFWRAYAVCRPEQIDGQFADSPKLRTVRKRAAVNVRTPAPPADWMQPAFEDATWRRSPGPFGGLPRDCGTLLLRARFVVNDPAGVSTLRLSARYRGGVVAYLNGEQVLRRNMPEGAVTAETPALAYRGEVYVDANGRLIPRRLTTGSDAAARAAKRDRSFESVPIPKTALREGVNVLAIAIHRSDFRPEAAKWPTLRDRSEAWAHLLLKSIRLAAVATGGAVTSGIQRPRGVQVFNQDIHRIFGLTEYGDPAEPLRPMRLSAPRGGCASGQVVLGSTDAIAGLSATVGDLTEAGGRVISAAAVRVRYGVQTKMRVSAGRGGLAYPGYVAIPAFASLMDTAPAEIKPAALLTRPQSRAALGLPAKMIPAAIAPVWVTVRVPRDCAPGHYVGSLQITAEGLERLVPVELDVIDWTMPKAEDVVTYMAANQSPETLAAYYKVPMWSQEHWELMDRSWELLGRIGNRLLVVPLVCRTQYGNDAGYVPVSRRADGSCTYDFTVYQRLVQLARKHCDIRVIAYQIYTATGWRPPGPEKEMFITEVDPATGKQRPMKLAPYDSEASTKFWKPLLDELRAVNAELGIDPKRIRSVLGIGQDGGINGTVRKHFEAMWPGIQWQYGAHNRVPRFYDIRRGRVRTYFGYSEYLYVGAIPALGSERTLGSERMYGWKINPIPTLMSQRIHDGGQPPTITRTMAERAIIRGDSGAGRMCLDYWDLPEIKRGSHYGTMYSRWPTSSAAQRTPHLKVLIHPGPDGAVPSIKLLPMIEGLQEAEARIRIEQALVGKKIGGDLAARAQALLDRRHDMLRAIDYLRYDVRPTLGAGWRAEAAELYRMAAEVAKALR